MATSHLGRFAVTSAAVLGFIGVVAACDQGGYGGWDGYGPHDQLPCANTVQQCREVCDYWCDYYDCYPECGEDCYDVCADSPGGSGDAATTVPDASAPVDAAVAIDAGSGTGVLCTECVANSDCEPGALCILRGGVRDGSADDAGAPVGRGFCGHLCSTSADCPQGFLCSQIGSTRQCLPTGNTCQ